MQLDVDVAIVGGGAAGSSAASTLRGLGLDVALIEREQEFRDRIRGETIHPWGANELRSLGLYDLLVTEADALPTPFWHTWRDRSAKDPYAWATDFPAAPNGLSARHTFLQRTLFDNAVDAGVRTFRPATTNLTRTSGGVTLHVQDAGGEHTIVPRLVIGADGQRSGVRRWIGGSARRDPIHHAIGGALVRGVDVEHDRIHQAWFEGGFVLVSPHRGDVARIYLICSRSEADRHQRGASPATGMIDRLRASTRDGVIGNWSAIGPAGFFPNANIVATIPETTDVLLIGDAAGASDPCQGQGLSMSFHDVRTLRDLILTGIDWRDVPTAFHQQRRATFEVILQHCRWQERLSTETGPEIDALRERIARARELDPSAGRFAGIFASGPAGLVADEAARQHWFGEDLVPVPA